MYWCDRELSEDNFLNSFLIYIYIYNCHHWDTSKIIIINTVFIIIVLMSTNSAQKLKPISDRRGILVWCSPLWTRDWVLKNRLVYWKLVEDMCNDMPSKYVWHGIGRKCKRILFMWIISDCSNSRNTSYRRRNSVVFELQ